MPEDFPGAVLREVDGQLVLDDPVALAVITAVENHNRAELRLACRATMKLNLERVHHFIRRIAERGSSVEDVVIVVLNVDDEHGGPVAEHLMPGHDWQPYRDRGETPFARGIAMRHGIEDVVDLIDKEAAMRLRETHDMTAVVVMDHGVVEIFRVAPPAPAAVMGPDFGEV